MWSREAAILQQLVDERKSMYRYHRVRHAAGALRPPADRDLKYHVRYERIAVENDTLSYTEEQGGRVGLYIASTPLKPSNNYFEVEIIDAGVNGTIGIGLVPAMYPLDRQPGWGAESIGYHADDGRLFNCNGFGRPFGSKAYAGDRIGCGVDFTDAFDSEDDKQQQQQQQQMVTVFFTCNGKKVGQVLCGLPQDGFFPAIGMHSEGEEVRLLMDANWQEEDVILMSIDNTEEEWLRLHDVRVNGQMLEYTGRGKSIVDVGLAQARYPLNPTNHYFEIEIIDPGANCYIAIGLAKRDYPRQRHPGWNKGSIAYHADDGKIFIGSGVGDHFGPKCHKGDIMGCGILFPRDYNYNDLDSDGSPDGTPDDGDDPIDALLELENYDDSASEDEEWWDQPYAGNGTKVQVFFTRNGKTIGRRDIRIPKGGFYPTVGMLSNDEKVKVDLRPLTG
ncbi:SPRY domain-containing protein 3-like [Tubulanus polymorphus]|uniref:SPRY domain-containing protein 3-like n=1 Tax=Tubulanus polymorphus TaxID=672921 RepID=UPI003DA5A28C